MKTSSLILETMYANYVLDQFVHSHTIDERYVALVVRMHTDGREMYIVKTGFTNCFSDAYKFVYEQIYKCRCKMQIINGDCNYLEKGFYMVILGQKISENHFDAYENFIIE